MEVTNKILVEPQSRIICMCQCHTKNNHPTKERGIIMHIQDPDQAANPTKLQEIAL